MSSCRITGSPANTCTWIPDEKHKDLYPVGSIPEPGTMWDDHATMSDSVKRVAMRLDDLTENDLKEPVPTELQGQENWVERSRWKYQRYLRDYLPATGPVATTG